MFRIKWQSYITYILSILLQAKAIPDTNNNNSTFILLKNILGEISILELLINCLARILRISWYFRSEGFGSLI